MFGTTEVSFGVRGLSPVITGRVLLALLELIDGALCTVMTEEDEAESGREGCRWPVGGFARDAISIFD